ncbi:MULTISPECIES: DUF333 domain-containing protein [unclassified Psychrobacter]|uniref:DUF333 domain-containing protein n=1 Tax=unclassified Psychrobacter TaxID=196806 RepID=UPI0025DDEC1F|nr:MULTISPECIES: DUF333 domain-containing protein [unclassified Psychrobacter]
MKNKVMPFLSLVSITMLISSCQTMTDRVNDKPIGKANPASVYCIDQGGQSLIKKDSKGAEIGYCRLPNGTMVNEWDFYRQGRTIQTSTDTSILIISYKPNEKDMALQAITALNGKIVYDYNSFNSFAASFDTKNIDTIKEKIEHNPSVISVERDNTVHLTTNL